MNVSVIVAAAGSSERYGGSDKLSQDLGGRAVLLRTVEVFAKRAEVGSIVVAGPVEGFGDFRDKYGPTLGFHGATVVQGGRTARWETVRNALEAVPDDATHVAVHDAARPVLLDDMLDREGRTALAQSAFDFLPTRAALDLAGYPDTDIFAHS